ncbi:hypothetical protein FG05_35032 [Fusarium graminearum]|nr:hypothetical protein FG05_35032 [Fusarium graminearum]
MKGLQTGMYYLNLDLILHERDLCLSR